MTATDFKKFQRAVLDYYAAHGRHELPWRVPAADGTFDPYKILVSEIMLQQTQVSRVIPKYHSFLARFPDVRSLAEASLGEVLTAWSGLGYNRRAKYLHQAAQALISRVPPWKYEELVACQGIGPNTAAAVLAYAYNQPQVFVETNIRTVYIHHFLGTESNISDREVAALVEQTLDRRNPRIWYWALMDYGVYLKQSVGNLNKLSKSYVRQSPFQGSLRQIRGQIIRQLADRPMDAAELKTVIADSRLDVALNDLLNEDMITLKNSKYMLA